MRASAQVMVYVDMEKAMKGGLRFFQSENGVILCAGNEKGFIPPEYFKEVEHKEGNGWKKEILSSTNTTAELAGTK